MRGLLFNPMTIVELISSLLALLGVWFTIRRSVLCWPSFIVSTILFAFVTLQAKLYADTLLQGIYLVASVYGAWKWWQQREGNTFTVKQIETMSLREWIIACSLMIILSGVTGAILLYFSDASIPIIDSLCFAASVLGQMLQAKKKIENWIIWIVADTAYTSVYIYKELYIFGILFLILTAMAVSGYITWKRELHRLTAQP